LSRILRIFIRVGTAGGRQLKPRVICAEAARTEDLHQQSKQPITVGAIAHHYLLLVATRE
jgi:uridine phosphorylase